jgi:hypothetical protein
LWFGPQALALSSLLLNTLLRMLQRVLLASPLSLSVLLVLWVVENHRAVVWFAGFGSLSSRLFVIYYTAYKSTAGVVGFGLLHF